MTAKAWRILGTLGLCAGLIIGFIAYSSIMDQGRFIFGIAELRANNNRAMLTLVFWVGLGIISKSITGSIARKQDLASSRYDTIHTASSAIASNEFKKRTGVDGRTCWKCGSLNTFKVSHKPGSSLVPCFREHKTNPFFITRINAVKVHSRAAS